jgi:hypothetical protein
VSLWFILSSPAQDSKVSQKYQGLIPLDDGYVREWLVLGGVPSSLNPRGTNVRADFVSGENDWRPREGYAFRHEKLPATREMSWKKFAPTGGELSGKAMGGGPRTMSYAAVYLMAPRAMPVDVVVKGPLHYTRLNGKELQPGPMGRAQLNAGVNFLLVRLNDFRGDTSVTVRLSSDDKCFAELRTTLNPEEQEEARSRSLLEPDPAFLLFPRPTIRVPYLGDALRPQVESMTRQALKFLLENQQANGGWSDTHFPDSVGVTALCCLALMAEGNLPNQGPHGKALNKGLEFLLGRFKEEGVCSSAKVEGYGVMYGHAMALVALLEVNGNMPWRPELEDRVAKGLQTILRYQRLDGGWRYELTTTGDSDISVTTTVLLVLGQARRYGYAVPRAVLDKALKFVEECGREDGLFMYRLNGLTKVMPHSGVGVAALYGAGKLDHPLLPKARALIAHEYQRYSVEDLASRPYFHFGSFFAGVAMYSSGKDVWQPWFGKTVQVFAHCQRKDGSLSDQTGNQVYPTALAAILLQAPNGYLSFFVQ